MVSGGHSHTHGIHQIQQLVDIMENRCTMLLPNGVSTTTIQIRNTHKLRIWKLSIQPGMVLAQMPNADNANFELIHILKPWVLLSARRNW
jgi:hypothetical protein